MLPSCKHVSEYQSENIDEPLRGIKWLKYKIHLFMCEACRRYGDQIDLSAKTINLAVEKKEPSEEAKAKMMERFKAECAKQDNPDQCLAEKMEAHTDKE